MTTKDKALEYAARGWSIIPVEARSKESHKELLKDTEGFAFKWQYFSHQKADAVAIKYWFETYPDANLAVVCGGISGLVVLDIDTPEALAYLRCLLPTGFVVPTVKTSRGEHWYFKFDPFNDVQGSGPGWDIRSTDQYALLPPSVHPTGVQYEWLVKPGYELPMMPIELREHLKVHARLDHSNSPDDHGYPDEDDDDWDDELDIFDDLDDYEDEDDFDPDDEDEDEGEDLGEVIIAEMLGFKKSDFIVDMNDQENPVPLAAVRTAESQDGVPLIQVHVYDNKVLAELDKEFWGPWDENLARFSVDTMDVPDEMDAQRCRMLAVCLLKAADIVDEHTTKIPF